MKNKESNKQKKNKERKQSRKRWIRTKHIND